MSKSKFSDFLIIRPILVIIFLLSQSMLLYSQEENKEQLDELFTMSIEELMNVKIVTAGKTLQKISDIPASAVIVTNDEIEKHGYQTLDEILQNIPGFFGINDYGEGGILFGVRGFWSGVPNDNIIILINNVPQTKNVFSNHPLSEIPVPVEAIEKIEVVRGPMSVIYGSGAFFGAINIITNNRNDSADENIISASFGSADTKQAFLKVSKNSGDLKYSANVSYYKTDGIDQPASKLMTDPSILTDYGLSADYRTSGSMSKDHKYFDFSAALKEIYFNLVIAEISEGTQFSFPSFEDGHKNTYSDINLAIGYLKQFSDKFTLNSKFTYYKDRSWFKYSFLKEDFFGIQQIESKAVEFTSDAFYKVDSKLNIQSGIYYKTIFDIYNMYDLPSFGDPFFDNNYINIDDDAITSMAFYTQTEYKPVENLHIVAGLRLEKTLKYKINSGYSYETDIFKKITQNINRDKIELIPRLAGIYNLNKNNIFKLLYGKAINRPSFFQDHVQAQADETFLKPEEVETRELNYQSAFSSDYSININLFHNILDNLITRIIILDDIGNYDSSYFSNAGKMITNGVEFTFTAKPLNNLFLEFSGTYQNTKNKQAGHKDIKAAYSPQHLGYIKMRYNVTKNLSIALNSQYVGSMETFWDDSPDETQSGYVPIGRIGDKAASYSISGLNFHYKNLFYEGIYINARISNLFDSEIRYPAFTNNTWADRGTLDYGRRFLITLGLKF